MAAPSPSAAPLPAPPAPAVSPSGVRLPRVYLWQQTIYHYRVPVFDDLRALGLRTGQYDLVLIGTLEPGNKAIGGEYRDYFIPCPEIASTTAGMGWTHWERWREFAERDQPEVVLAAANLRSTSTWAMARYFHQRKVPFLGWSKINSFSRMAALTRPFKKLYYSRFDKIVVYAQSSRQELMKVGIPDSKIIVAQNTIDTRRIFTDGQAIAARAAQLRAAHGLEGKKLLLCIGRMDPVKRHGDLLDAWPRLKLLDPDLHLVLISGGPLLNEIRARAKEIDPDRILVTGRVPEGDDYCWIAASDLCVYPGAVGLAINQGLALGKPTIIADEWGADGELIEAGKTGYRYERGNLDALVGAVAHVLQNPAEAAGYARTAMAVVRDNVTIENYVNKLDEAIRYGLELRRQWTTQ